VTDASRTQRDVLTGLRIEGAVDRHARYRAMIWIDVDHLKEFNDEVGHAAGDRAVTRIAHAIRDQAGDDVTCRAAGDEFLIVLEDSWEGDAAVLAERIRGAVSRLGVPLTVSAGVATASEEHEGWSALIVAAERRAALAKGMGRNRVVAADVSDRPS
jgi:diguanylate cyclase (GGDEF)-like protein